MKYILVSGGGISGIGKGIIASSTGLLLKVMGLKVTAIKIDPYLNIDAGLMTPMEHGEVFVLDDGGEVDLDLGNYERYLQLSMTRDNNITTGKIYQSVIEAERRGDFLGKTVQVVPHITNATQDWCERVAAIPVDDSKETPDVCIIELGGTVGDIESAPFIESMRRLRMRAGSKENFLHIHVTYIPVINGEQKTKLTQQAIRDVRSAGLFPDLIACRCEEELEPSTVAKVAQYCQVEPSQVVAAPQVSNTYLVPVLLEKQGMQDTLRNLLRLEDLAVSKSLIHRGAQTWDAWTALTDSQVHVRQEVTIALVGKYTKLHDCYFSVIKSLEHSAMACSRKLKIEWVKAEDLETKAKNESARDHYEAWHKICTADGILVPGGFGDRGIEGMVEAAKYARLNSKPYLGICLGMQIAVIEYARDVCGIAAATTEEVDANASDPVVIFMPEIDRTNLGGTMRLGLRATHFQPGSEWSKLRALYGEEEAALSSSSNHTSAANGVSNGTTAALLNGTTANGPTTTKAPPTEPLIIRERHRHRYEVNPAYIDVLAQNGLSFVGKDDKGERMEIMELKDHPWY
ncbi:MAG: hypothetical protein Q9191_005257, partial [Dirinaria sp. TL-2023a]